MTDREQARERMRRLRAKGPTPNDRARNEAIRNLIALHPAEFAHLLYAAKRKHGAADAMRTRVRPPEVLPPTRDVTSR